MNKRQADAWQELKTACREHHEKQKGSHAGGQAHCICGHPNGGSGACAMLEILRETIMIVPIGMLPVKWKKEIEDLREVLDA